MRYIEGDLDEGEILDQLRELSLGKDPGVACAARLMFQLAPGLRRWLEDEQKRGTSPGWQAGAVSDACVSLLSTYASSHARGDPAKTAVLLLATISGPMAKATKEIITKLKGGPAKPINGADEIDDEMAVRSDRITAIVASALAGEEPFIQGFCIAEVFARFVAGHPAEVREEVIASTVGSLRRMVEVMDENRRARA